VKVCAHQHVRVQRDVMALHCIDEELDEDAEVGVLLED
jgi:hypothetical protein